MIRRVLLVILAGFCIYLDIVFFARANILDIRPDAMLAISVSYGVLMGPLPGAVLGIAGGLLSDLLAGPALGLNAAMYLLCGLAGGFFYKKFYADNIIIPAITAAACGFMKDFLMAFIRLAGGARFSFAQALVRYVLPCALLTGILCILVHIVLKPIVARQIKRQHTERVTARSALRSLMRPGTRSTLRSGRHE